MEMTASGEKSACSRLQVNPKVSTPYLSSPKMHATREQLPPHPLPCPTYAERDPSIAEQGCNTFLQTFPNFHPLLLE